MLLPLKSQLRVAEREGAAAREEVARLSLANDELRVELERVRAMNRVLAQAGRGRGDGRGERWRTT